MTSNKSQANKPIIDHEKERKKDVDIIIDSNHPRKVVVAGPGTGKSFLFKQLIQSEKNRGKKDFLAITFIGKLCDDLADDLAGLAKTTTLHSFAKEFVEKNCPDFNYYPDIHKLIEDDLKIMEINDYVIGDEAYKERTYFYKAVGHADVVFYAVQFCKKHPEKIPIYDLILVDEYQDFNQTESEFIDQLASKNNIIIVGDDDQALYEFKGSSPNFIRENTTVRSFHLVAKRCFATWLVCRQNAHST